MTRMMQKEPEERLGLLEFMDLEYYSIDDNVFETRVNDIVKADE